jgi:hypothetical protein
MIGGKQGLSLLIGSPSTGTCLTKDTVAHEFIHALGKLYLTFFTYDSFVLKYFTLFKKKGFDHEQTRPDRDTYVEYHPENLISGK